jgi:hypothetical protein
MQVCREVGSGVSVVDVRRVVASTVGVGEVAHSLGVSRNTAHRWARLAGVKIQALPPTARQSGRQRVSDADVDTAIRGPLSLRAAAAALGISSPSLLARARYLGLPTSPAGRATLRGTCA